MPVLTIQPDSTTGDDTFISSANATTNYGTDAGLKTGRESTTNTLRSLLRFDTSGVPAGATINSVTLTLRMTFQDANAYNAPHSVYLLRVAFVQGQATWNIYSTGNNWATAGCGSTTDDYFPTAVGTFTTPGNADDIDLVAELDVTDLADLANGLFVRMDTEGDFTKVDLGSSNSGFENRRPKLDIDYTEAGGVVVPVIMHHLRQQGAA